MHDHENTRPPDRTPAPDRTPQAPPAGLLRALQGSAGNAAVVQLLRQAGHPWAQAPHQHGAGCGHRPAGQLPLEPVQRSAVHDVLRSPGSPLDDATRTEMEARLGADFSDVSIHTGAAAEASAAEIGARAYTSGNHIVIGAGGNDRHTLAHELTHVIQQRSGPVTGTDNGSGLRVSDPSDAFERAAEENATRVLSGPVPEKAAAGRSPAAVAPAEGAVQRRGENPHAKPNVHQGWDTTAHHVIAHSTLVGALDGLGEADQMDVLTAAVPTEITEEMLKNLKVTFPSGREGERFRKELRQRLRDKNVPHTETVSEISFKDIRRSFFEWQAGNQFIGPSTSIRAEPSEAKDDIDYDGKYFASMGRKKFDQLTGLGDQLKTLKNSGASALADQQSETPEQRKERTRKETAATLMKIVALTRNEKVAAFDADMWTEVDSHEGVDRLAADEGLDRAHITGYTHFRFNASDIAEKKHRYLTEAATGGGFEFNGKPLNKVQRRGAFVYIPYLTDEQVPAPEGKPGANREMVADYCKRTGIPTSTFLPKALYKGRNVVKG